MHCMQGMLAKVPGSEKMLPLWLDFYQNYKAAVMGSDQEGANEYLATKIQATIADVVTMQYVKPFTFGSHHERITGPDYDYFEFGQSYVGSLTDFKNSCLGHAERWDKVAELLKQNHNVVLLANHQTEADPGVFAHMLMSRHPQLATDVIYVAGDRVVTDALSKPFSMGRNLFCVHSKKHLDDVPELKASKMETNRKTLVAMQRALNKVGKASTWGLSCHGHRSPHCWDQLAAHSVSYILLPTYWTTEVCFSRSCAWRSWSARPAATICFQTCMLTPSTPASSTCSCT